MNTHYDSLPDLLQLAYQQAGSPLRMVKIWDEEPYHIRQHAAEFPEDARRFLEHLAVADI